MIGRDIVEQILKVFWLFPIRVNRIVFRSAQGTKYNCNPKYISEYFEKNYPGKFQIIWLFDNPEDYSFLRDRGILCVKQKSLAGIFYSITAKILIDNHGVQSYIPIRAKQIVVNTWHGGGSYKKSYANHTKQHIQYVKKMNRETTIFLSSCERFSKCNLKAQYDNHPEKVMGTGMARNDLFFLPINEKKKTAIKRALGIPYDKKVLLYAPTFRDDVSEENYKIDVDKLLDACEERFGGEFILAVRFHRFAHNTELGSTSEKIINVNDYDDMQEIIYASDVVISDYSSLIWDVSIAHKPCFIYAMDLQKYLEDRNFYTPISEWPFPLAESMDGLIENILRFDAQQYEKQVADHHKALGSYETGTAARQIVEYLVSII